MPSLAHEIKRLRGELNLTQVELAAKTGVTQGAISALENGRNIRIEVDTLYKLSDALGVPSDHWRPFIDAPAKPPSPAGRGKRK